MPRPRRCRRIGFQPDIVYFKPAGVRLVNLEEATLTFDELEALRLKDLEGVEQENAAKKMEISQPTFHRLIIAARKKVADALINGKAINIEGGNFKMAQTRRGFSGFKGRGVGLRGPAMFCLCPKCKYKEEKIRGIRCIDKKCPKCGTPMIGANRYEEAQE